VSDSPERRRDDALRRRIDQLLGRVRAAQDDIVERGLSAVHDPSPDGDPAPRPARDEDLPPDAAPEPAP
jgi:hypothetical protein